MKLSSHCNHLRVIPLAFLILILSACTSSGSEATTSTDPQVDFAYILVTANPLPTSTPFQPVQPTGQALLPTGVIPPTLTPRPSDSPQPTLTPFSTITTQPTTTPQPTDTPFIPPTAIPDDTQQPIPPASTILRPQYAISVMMNYAGHAVTVSENVVYPNRTGATLSSIALAVNPNLWKGVFNLQTLAVNDQPASNYTLSGQWLMINLDTQLQAGQAVKIGIGYQLALPSSSGKFENFGYTAHQINLIDWYPFVPPYIGGQWILPDPYPYGENLVYEKADFQIGLSFSDPANAPVVAASAPAKIENGLMVYNLPNARNFTISASPDYLLSTADANGITIYNYYFAADARAAANVQEMTREAVNTYSSVFGPYVHGALSVCETDLNDGLETDGLYFLASSFYQNYDGTVHNNLSTIAVHETAHQWWYGAVANNQADEPWLDEALATYTEHVFYENNYPDLVNWWWNFRINSHNPTGWVDSRIYDTATFNAYINAVYFNGANFLHALRGRVGDTVFFAFLRDYYARNNGRISTANDFFNVLDLHTSVDYSDLVKAYFHYR